MYVISSNLTGCAVYLMADIRLSETILSNGLQDKITTYIIVFNGSYHWKQGP